MAAKARNSLTQFGFHGEIGRFKRQEEGSGAVASPALSGSKGATYPEVTSGTPNFSTAGTLRATVQGNPPWKNRNQPQKLGEIRCGLKLLVAWLYLWAPGR
jgi:hypothetical protein